MADVREITMPQLGTNDDRAKVVRWLASAGDIVSTHQEVVELETSKAVFALESDFAGHLYPVVGLGEMVLVGRPLALVLDGPDDGAVEAFRRAQPKTREPAQVDGDEVLLTARASELVERASIDRQSLPRGRILREADVQAVIEAREGASLRRDPLRNVAVYGASQGGRAVAEAITANGGYRVSAYLDDTPGLAGQTVGNIPIWSGEELDQLLGRGIGSIATHISIPAFRLELRDRAAAAGIVMLNVIHPSATLAPSVSLGVGNIIKAGAVLDTEVRVGDCCIIDNGAIVPHNNVIGSGCHLAPGATLGGDCLIGDTTAIGIGAVVASRTHIGSNVIVSPGAVVIRDVPDDVVVEGLPARVIGSRR